MGLVMMVGVLLIPIAVGFLKVSGGLKTDAIWLLGVAVVGTALSLPLRNKPGFLAAEERFHWVPLIQGVAIPWSQFLVFYLGLRAGWGVRSYAASIVFGPMVNWFCYSLLIRTSSQRPRFDRTGITRDRFSQLFKFSGGLMAISIVDSFINTLPAMILARMGGIGMVPVYNFSVKGANLGGNAVTRIYQAFQPGWQRSFVSGDMPKFIAKFEVAGYMMLGMGLCGAAVTLAVNPWLVLRLAGSEYFAGMHANIWIAVGVITIPFGYYFQSLLTLSGAIGRAPLFFLFKLAVAITSGIAAWHWAGLAGLAGTFALMPLFNVFYCYVIGSRRCGFRRVRGVAPRVLALFVAALAAVILAGYGSLWTEQPVMPERNATGLGVYSLTLASGIFLFGVAVFAWGLYRNLRTKR
jgi:O-antigen/teichoic acid export membrane protein